MRRSLSLVPHNGVGDPLVFEWDPTAGTVSGPGAEYVREAVREALAAGYATGHPYPTPYRVSAPLFTPQELAVVLGNEWQLPADLQAVYPAAPTEPGDEEGKIH